MRYDIITPEKFKSMPWRNGKGITQELFARTETRRDGFTFRLSIAGVTENGPFSSFSGYDRVLMMLEGNGIVLHHSDGSSNVIKSFSDMAVFSGDLKTEAELPGGAIKDFNVMTLREVCSSEVIAINGEAVFTESKGELFILCCGDNVEVEIEDRTTSLEHYDLLHLSDVSSCTVRVIGDAIAVKIIYNQI